MHDRVGVALRNGRATCSRDTANGRGVLETVELGGSVHLGRLNRVGSLGPTAISVHRRSVNGGGFFGESE